MKSFVVAHDGGEGFTELNRRGVAHASAREGYYFGGIQVGVLERLGIGRVYGLPDWRLGAPESADALLQNGFDRQDLRQDLA
jgi:hypothetical protein